MSPGEKQLERVPTTASHPVGTIAKDLLPSNRFSGRPDGATWRPWPGGKAWRCAPTSLGMRYSDLPAPSPGLTDRALFWRHVWVETGVLARRMGHNAELWRWV